MKTSPPSPPAAAVPAVPPARIASIDAYRGLVMFLMMAEVLRLQEVAKQIPTSAFWKFLAWHQTHVPWAGCTLHDLIQPSFSFLVGVSLPFSLASREARGDSRSWMIARAAWRGVLLAALGIFLRSMGKPQTNFTFDDTLTQIGCGYLPLFLLGMASVRMQWGALVAILIGWWLAFLAYPLPGADFDYAAVGVPADWPHHYAGLAGHWNKNSNLAWAFDTWWMNLFPRDKPFTHSGGGYATLNFIPTLGTMILGLIAGGRLKERQTESTPPWRLVGYLTIAGLLFLAAGWILDITGVCPAVKRIWTPAWVLFSGGWCLLFLAAFYAVCDVLGYRAWSFPLRVIGANSIVAYCIAHGSQGFIFQSVRTHFGPNVFGIFGPEYVPLTEGLTALAVWWLVLWWLYRQRVHVRI